MTPTHVCRSQMRLWDYDVKRTHHTGYDRVVGEVLSEGFLVTNAILDDDNGSPAVDGWL